jgi:hypothetical protein
MLTISSYNATTGTIPSEEYTFFCRKGNGNNLGIGIFVHERIISAVKGVSLFMIGCCA